MTVSTSPLITPDLLRDLYAHMEWADARIWSVVREHETVSRDPFVREKLAHIHLVHWVWLHTWTDRPWQPPDTQQGPDAQTIWRWARPYYADVRAFLDTVTPERLVTPLPDAFMQQIEEHLGPGARRPTIGESAYQVASHTTHHRGQLATRIRALGVAPPPVDYIVWVWHDRPAAE